MSASRAQDLGERVSPRSPFQRPLEKTDIAANVGAGGKFPAKTLVDDVGVSRSNFAEHIKHKSTPFGLYIKADDAEPLPRTSRMLGQPTAIGG